jgi:NADPH-dependent ferric siderophore reductase
MPVRVFIEIADPRAEMPLAVHPGVAVRPGVTVSWCQLPSGAAPGDALAAAVSDAEIAPDTRIWVAGEAAGVQRIRRNLFELRGWPRSLASVRGYWKHGRSGDTED